MQNTGSGGLGVVSFGISEGLVVLVILARVVRRVETREAYLGGVQLAVRP